MRTLVLMDTDGSELSSASLSALSAAHAFGKPVDAVLIGALAQEKIQGVDTLYRLENELSPSVIAKSVHALLGDGYSRVVSANDNLGKAILPRLAGLADVQPIMDVIKIVSDDTFVRPLYAGAIQATLKSVDKIKLVAIRPSSFPKFTGTNEAARSENLTLATTARPERVTVSVSDAPKANRLENARIVVSGGKALKSAQNFKEILYPFADKLHAAVGASRAAVDADFAPNELQVGQTGKIVAPEIYIAVGLSGAAQHVAGMQDSKTVFAINLDPDAPIYKVADYGLEADLFDVLPKLTAEL